MRVRMTKIIAPKLYYSVPMLGKTDPPPDRNYNNLKNMWFKIVLTCAWRFALPIPFRKKERLDIIQFIRSLPIGENRDHGLYEHFLRVCLWWDKFHVMLWISFTTNEALHITEMCFQIPFLNGVWMFLGYT